VLLYHIQKWHRLTLYEDELIARASGAGGEVALIEASKPRRGPDREHMVTGTYSPGE
jgi:hypothetical protein